MVDGYVPHELVLEHIIKDVERYPDIDAAEAEGNQEIHDGKAEYDVSSGTAPVNVGAHPHGGPHSPHATKDVSYHQERPSKQTWPLPTGRAAPARKTIAHVAAPTVASA